MARNIAPIAVTLYGDNDEVVDEFKRLIVPAKILKHALRIKGSLSPGEEMSEEDIDAIYTLLVETFDNKFTASDVENHMDLGEVLSAFGTIVMNAEKALGGAGMNVPLSRKGVNGEKTAMPVAMPPKIMMEE